MEEERLIVEDQVDVHHIKKVLRLRPGERVELVYDGHLYHGELLEAGTEAVFTVLNEVEKQTPGIAITLIQGYPKGSKINEILMHGTECGVDHFVIAQMDRTIGKVDPKKRDRYQRIIKDASKQSKRLRIPEVSFEAFSKLDFSRYDRVYFFYEGSNEPIRTNHSDRSIAILIGPEGGFSDEEIELVRKLPHITEASLGRTIYRTETAGLVACAVLRDRLEAR